MNKTIYVYPLIFLATLCSSSLVLPQEYNTFKTDYTTIHYLQDVQLNDFLWRIGRLRLGPTAEASLAKSRIDRIAEQVELTLDMYPENFHVDIFLCSGYKEGNIALYSDKTKSIKAFVDRVTDGVLAHEVAHAVIDAYFKTPPSYRIEEMLCQYVDAHLWQDYE